MTDKVQLIKEEIERRISQFEAKYPKDLGGYWNDEESAAYDCAEEYKRFLLFIDSLLEEPTSEDLEEEILCRWEDDPHTPWPKCPYSDFKNIAHHFAEWQKQQIMKDAVDCDVFKKEDNMADLRWKDNTAFERLVSKFNDGDKVKLIIINEDLED